VAADTKHARTDISLACDVLVLHHCALEVDPEVDLEVLILAPAREDTNSPRPPTWGSNLIVYAQGCHLISRTTLLFLTTIGHARCPID
jgi:hypothetical protein